MRAKKVFTLIAAAALIVGLATACTSKSDSSGISDTGAVDEHGKLLTQQPLTNSGSLLGSAILSATYLQYVSTAPDGSPIEVSGAVFLPKGPAPEGGWPLIAFAHGTSGVVTNCAPTNSPVLYGNDVVVSRLLNDHKAVVMTNYQGLDGPGGTPYLDAPSSGYNVLDSVRAAQSTGLPLSKDIVLVGLSQGGRATESAAETLANYTPELNIRGNLLLSPAIHVDLAGSVASNTLSTDQYLILPYMVAAVRYNNPDYSYDKVLHGPLLAAAPRLETACTGQSLKEDVAVGQSATPAEATFVDAAAQQAFADFESRGNLPKTGTTIPTYIARGDNDLLVRTDWGNQAVAEMCRLGTPLQDKLLPGGHEAFHADSAHWIGWINDRFAGAPAPATTCRN